MSYNLDGNVTSTEKLDEILDELNVITANKLKELSDSRIKLFKGT